MPHQNERIFSNPFLNDHIQTTLLNSIEWSLMVEPSNYPNAYLSLIKWTILAVSSIPLMYNSDWPFVTCYGRLDIPRGACAQSQSISTVVVVTRRTLPQHDYCQITPCASFQPLRRWLIGRQSGRPMLRTKRHPSCFHQLVKLRFIC